MTDSLILAIKNKHKSKNSTITENSSGIEFYQNSSSSSNNSNLHHHHQKPKKTTTGVFNLAVLNVDWLWLLAWILSPRFMGIPFLSHRFCDSQGYVGEQN